MEEKRYVRNDDGDIVENNESGSQIINILMKGDLVRIEYYSLAHQRRISRLFEVDDVIADGEYIQLSNAHCNFTIANGDFLPQYLELKPVIKSVITIEKLESVQCDLFQPKLKY